MCQYTSLICDFCPSDQRFAYSFLQIPSHDGHPCCSAIHFPLSGRVRDFHPLERAHGAQTKERTGLYHNQSSVQRKICYHNSNESSASIHVCIPPSRYSVAYSSGLSIAKAFKVHSEHGVVFSPSSAFPQSIRKHIRQKWLHQYCYGAYYTLHE